MLKIRRPLGRLIFNMGIAIPGKTVFLIETAPWALIQYTDVIFLLNQGPDSNPYNIFGMILNYKIASMDSPPQNLGEPCQALLDEWTEIPGECLQCFVASMPRRIVAIIAARGGSTQYRPGIHKTKPTGSIIQKKKNV